LSNVVPFPIINWLSYTICTNKFVPTIYTWTSSCLQYLYWKWYQIISIWIPNIWYSEISGWI